MPTSSTLCFSGALPSSHSAFPLSSVNIPPQSVLPRTKVNPSECNVILNVETWPTGVSERKIPQVSCGQAAGSSLPPFSPPPPISTPHPTQAWFISVIHRRSPFYQTLLAVMHMITSSSLLQPTQRLPASRNHRWLLSTRYVSPIFVLTSTLQE